MARGELVRTGACRWPAVNTFPSLWHGRRYRIRARSGRRQRQRLDLPMAMKAAAVSVTVVETLLLRWRIKTFGAHGTGNEYLSVIPPVARANNIQSFGCTSPLCSHKKGRKHRYEQNVSCKCPLVTAAARRLSESVRAGTGGGAGGRRRAVRWVDGHRPPGGLRRWSAGERGSLRAPRARILTATSISGCVAHPHGICGQPGRSLLLWGCNLITVRRF